MKPTPLPLTLYGGNDCDDTEYVTGRLNALGISFRAIMLEDDADAERFVIFINNGFRSTPTLVFGDGNYKIILTEPEAENLVTVLREAGYLPTG